MTNNMKKGYSLQIALFYLSFFIKAFAIIGIKIN